ncbi:hypothetical protein [Coraliomargarita akajimensis]|uniref:Rhomboid family protein n=1 Tax=Coraliomargarita akajimensis (strain DSM 45221 / IAM 15411 / JCM 23193 / KCTC 12865 / 04OKA010-24) TaxID=583355 RepID=D5EII3_CORAD|nr:hypothetical protein [Coraliomargarita akajimensis]ADE54249.1 rhomboid family protein [Coraliomargarita akajimensis DSM 45221]
MSSPLAQARCFKHVSREAVARCPECAKFYCRECVTEHEGRMICRDCLDTLLNPAETSSNGWLSSCWTWLLASAGAIVIVAVFYYLGRILLRIPSNFHSGVFFE